MILDEPFQINSSHWVYAVFFALVAHLLFFLVYQPSQESRSEGFSQKSLIINLKKLTSPPNIKPPPIIQPRVEPLPEPKSEPKPKLKKKPIEKPKPKLEAKPNAVVKPVKIHQPELEPLQYNQTANLNDRSSKLDSSKKLSYEYQLLEWLQRHKKYPDIARRRGQQGTVTFEFAINAEGKLLSYKILNPAKHAALNKAVVRMIKQASPLPPVPMEIRNNRDIFSYTIPIHFVLKNK